MLHMILLLATVLFKTINHSNILYMLAFTVGPYATRRAMYGVHIYKGMNFNSSMTVHCRTDDIIVA